MRCASLHKSTFYLLTYVELLDSAGKIYRQEICILFVFQSEYLSTVNTFYRQINSNARKANTWIFTVLTVI